MFCQDTEIEDNIENVIIKIIWFNSRKRMSIDFIEISQLFELDW